MYTGTGCRKKNFVVRVWGAEGKNGLQLSTIKV